MFKKRNKQTTGIDINEIEHKNHEKEPETQKKDDEVEVSEEKGMKNNSIGGSTKNRKVET